MLWANDIAMLANKIYAVTAAEKPTLSQQVVIVEVRLVGAIMVSGSSPLSGVGMYNGRIPIHTYEDSKCHPITSKPSGFWAPTSAIGKQAGRI